MQARLRMTNQSAISTLVLIPPRPRLACTPRALDSAPRRAGGRRPRASPNEGACDWCDGAPGRNGPSTLSYSKKLSSSHAQPVMPLASAARAGATCALCARFRVGARFTRRRRAFAREPRAFVSSRGRSTGTHALKSRAFHRERRVRDHLAGRTAEFLVRAVRVYGLAAPPRRRLASPHKPPHTVRAASAMTRPSASRFSPLASPLATPPSSLSFTSVDTALRLRASSKPCTRVVYVATSKHRGLETHAHAANAGARRRKRFGLLRARLAAYARLGPPRRRRAPPSRRGAAPQPSPPRRPPRPPSRARSPARPRAPPESPTCLTLHLLIPRFVSRLRQRLG